MPREYLIAWIVYAVAALGAIVSGWMLTRHWHGLPRGLVRGVAIAVIVTPVVTEIGRAHYAPAFIVLIFEALLKRDGDAVAAAIALSLATIGLWCCFGLAALVRRIRRV